MNNYVKSIAVLLLAIFTSITAIYLKPNKYTADTNATSSINDIIPENFGEWKHIKNQDGLIINPIIEAEVSKIYKETLSRIYKHDKGSLIMLSIAYGVNQSDEFALHYPEVCYPVQGFEIISSNKDILDAGYKKIPIKKLFTKNRDRIEHVLYWTLVGEQVSQGGLSTKISQLRYGLNGYIPDGLIFRISTINTDADVAFKNQTDFVQDLVKDISTKNKSRIIGVIT